MNRYSVQVQEVGSDQWETVYYTDDGLAARRIADGVARLARIAQARVVDWHTARVCYMVGKGDKQ